MSLFIFSVCLSLGVSFLCSIAEATLLSITQSQINMMKEKHMKAHDIWKKFRGNIDRPISLILLVNTTAHTVGASIAGAQFDAIYGEEWILAFSLIFTFLMLQYTEIAPKTLALKHNYRFAIAIAIPMDILLNILAPFLKLLHILNYPFSNKRKNPPQNITTIEELNSVASMARLSNIIGLDQEKIITNVPKLSLVNARQIMIPVEQVVFLKAENTIKEALTIAGLDTHTRFPVFSGGDINNIVGYINIKEIIFHIDNDLKQNEQIYPIRPVKFISPDTKAQELLKLFIGQYHHVAIVQEDGKTLGLITIEDVLEEILGDLQDEFDKLPKIYQQVSKNRWIVGGGLTVKEVNGQLDSNEVVLNGNDENDGNDEDINLSTWIIQKMNKIPKTGDSLKFADKKIVVKRVRRGQVFEVSLFK